MNGSEITKQDWQKMFGYSRRDVDAMNDITNHWKNRYTSIGFTPLSPESFILQGIKKMFNKDKRIGDLEASNAFLLKELDNHRNKENARVRKQQITDASNLAKIEKEKFTKIHKIGGTFDYCGRFLTVREILQPNMYTGSIMVCEYSNEAGDIRKHTFYLKDLQLLRTLS